MRHCDEYLINTLSLLLFCRIPEDEGTKAAIRVNDESQVHNCDNYKMCGRGGRRLTMALASQQRGHHDVSASLNNAKADLK